LPSACVYNTNIHRCVAVCVAVRCSVLQSHRGALEALLAVGLRVQIQKDTCVLQRVAACCSVLQCVAVCCSVLQCVAVCCRVIEERSKRCLPSACVYKYKKIPVSCSVLQRVAVCCSVLQCVAVCCRGVLEVLLAVALSVQNKHIPAECVMSHTCSAHPVQPGATHCNTRNIRPISAATFDHAPHCNTWLKSAATHCKTRLISAATPNHAPVKTLKHTATHCNA